MIGRVHNATRVRILVSHEVDGTHLMGVGLYGSLGTLFDAYFTCYFPPVTPRQTLLCSPTRHPLAAQPHASLALYSRTACRIAALGTLLEHELRVRSRLQ